MKILHVYKDYDPPVHGGMERHLANTCRFQRQWADVEALVCSRSIWTRFRDHEGVMITEVGEWGRFQSAPFSILFPWYLRKIRADIVVVHVPNPTAEIGWLLARPKAKLIVRYQSDVVRQATAMKLYKPFQMHFMAQADTILPSSNKYLETSPLLKEFSTRCRVVPLGIMPEEFAHPSHDAVKALRDKYGHPFVLFSGRHRYYKGLRYLVEAAPHIKANVVIAGDGPERKICMELASQFGGKVFFPGTLTHQELVNHLHACSVFAFPSCERSEAYGISMLEAHACGKPVVATFLNTGVEEVNRDGETGLNVPPKNSHALAEALNTLLIDEALRDMMGQQAQKRVYDAFHAEVIARKEFEIYLDMT